MKRCNKKGISPLVATVLLVGFTLALAIVVWMWAGGFLEERAQKAGKIANAEISCITDVGFSVIESCKSNNKLTITVENRKSEPLNGFTLRIEDGDNFEVKSITQQINNLEVKKLSVETNINPQSFVLVPQIIIGSGEEASCPKSSVKVEDIKEC